MNTSTIPDARTFLIVGIGGSAGGLAAYKAMLAVLPPNTGMAFVVIAHLDPTRESLLPQVLSWSTNMEVRQAAEGMCIEPNRVFVIPPNVNLYLEDGAFALESPRTLHDGRHRQVDFFLTSLAGSVGPRAIGIILSGGDGDGTEGCKAIKAHGGVTFAQDLSAQVDSMPLHALAAGCVDKVLPPAEIAEQLVAIGRRFAQGEPLWGKSP